MHEGKLFLSVVTLSCVLILAIPATAGSIPPPYLTDAHIARPVIEDASGSDNIYNDLAKQTMTSRVKRGQSAEVLIGGGQDGTEPDILRVAGCRSAVGFRVTYRDFDDVTAITKQVVNGTFETGTLTSGSTFTWVHMEVRVTKRADRGDKLLCKVRVSSTNGSSSDTVAHKIVAR